MSTPQPPHASPTPHLDVETLADLQADLLDPDRVTAVESHLAGCDRCRATRASLDDVRLLLRDAGTADSGLAPEDVVRRVDGALAAAGRPVAAASATVVPITTAGRSPWRTHALQAAAVFVLVAAVGGLGYGGIRALTNKNTGSSGTAASTAGRGTTTEKRAGTYSLTNSGRDYSQATLRAAVPELLAGSLRAADGTTLGTTKVPGAAAAPGATPTPSSSGSLAGSPAATDPQRLRSGPALAACITNLTGGAATPLAVDLGRFEGKPATIIVLPDPSDPSLVDVFAVAPDCPTGTWLTLERVALP
jgi:hypothetical protein